MTTSSIRSLLGLGALSVCLLAGSPALAKDRGAASDSDPKLLGLLRRLDDQAEIKSWTRVGPHRATYDGDDEAVTVTTTLPSRTITRIYDLSNWGSIRMVSRSEKTKPGPALTGRGKKQLPPAVAPRSRR